MRILSGRLFKLFLAVSIAISFLTISGRQVYAQIDRGGQLRLLTAIGNSEIRVRPDLGIVQLGVETEASTASEARQQNAVRAGKVVDAIRVLGIPEQSVETSIFQIFPVRRFKDRGEGEPPIVGYRVVNIVTVRTERLDLVPRIIDSSIKAGANRVDNVNFALRDDSTVKQKALRQAVADARRNAEQMAKELGVNLVRVQSVQQGGFGGIPSPMFWRGLVAEAAAPTPIFPGEVTVSASATLAYVIK